MSSAAVLTYFFTTSSIDRLPNNDGIEKIPVAEFMFPKDPVVHGHTH